MHLNRAYEHNHSINAVRAALRAYLLASFEVDNRSLDCELVHVWIWEMKHTRFNWVHRVHVYSKDEHIAVYVEIIHSAHDSIEATPFNDEKFTVRKLRRLQKVL